LAVDADPLVNSRKAPAEIEVFWRVEEHVVAPSKPVVPPVLEQAIPPLEAVASAEDKMLEVDPAVFFLTMTLGVPASAATVTSTMVAA
jgi:hypothetical protein